MTRRARQAVRWFICLALCAAPAFSRGGPPPKTDWSIIVGGGLLFAPLFEGAAVYGLKILPNVRVDYRDRFFLNWQDGIGYRFHLNDRWSIAPFANTQFSRSESADSVFQVAGASTNALRGLGDVPLAVNLGAMIRYAIGHGWSTTLTLAHGLTAHRGFHANLAADYKFRVGPLMLSGGPAIGVASARYLNTYFGIDATQSLASGLPTYHSGWNLLHYGVNGMAIMPVSKKTSLALFANLKRLGPGAARSPLVTERGSPNQAVVGLFFSMRFGFGHRHSPLPATTP